MQWYIPGPNSSKTFCAIPGTVPFCNEVSRNERENRKMFSQMLRKRKFPGDRDRVQPQIMTTLSMNMTWLC